MPPCVAFPVRYAVLHPNFIEFSGSVVPIRCQHDAGSDPAPLTVFRNHGRVLALRSAVLSSWLYDKPRIIIWPIMYSLGCGRGQGAWVGDW